MNNLKKLGLTALAGSLAVTGANATEYAVTGDAVLKYASIDYPAGAESTFGKGLGVDTDLYFNASGELDNGFTVAFSKLLTQRCMDELIFTSNNWNGFFRNIKSEQHCWCCW